ncbi:hypothetical protein BKA82DRAFT_22332 [Pisolithus tinctorius]|uniref:Uncharacterized protein n=1 Tax=Pisolithus tinctorius Marx 270 TaxID=870435 RepID=A0A0C3JJ58_PISTI|nr:hypothetical protein BKA82DRAFT_22332 [Pisolithus tinctorius]KIO09138.1 hypothetical protein M404DRAFT_22332 [Pisolithus tinctorius Marx 270]
MRYNPSSGLYESEINNLQNQLTKTATERDTIKAAFHSLISVLKLPDDTDPLTFSLADVITQGPPTLDERTLKEKHPAVRFWTKVDYDAFTLSPESQGLDRGKAPWLELENGDPLTSQQLSAVRTTLRSAWAELVQRKLALPTWTKVSTSGKELIYKIMVKKHPLFALDNDGFKLEMLCVTDYPKWHKNHLTPTGEWKDASSSKAPLKEESEEASDGAVVSPLDLKGKKCENDDGGGMPPLSHPHPRTKRSKGTMFDFLRSPLKNRALCGNKKASGYLVLPSPIRSRSTSVPPAKCSTSAASSALPRHNSNKENEFPLANPLSRVFGVQGVPKRAPLVPAQPRVPPASECTNSEPLTVTAKVDGKKVSKNGTTEEFRVYWDALTATQREDYRIEAEQLEKEGLWTKPSDPAICKGKLH